MKPKLAKRNEPEYFLRHTEEAPEEGPFTIDVLREKALAGEIVRETWFRRAEESEFRQLREDPPMAADLWPEERPFFPEEAGAGPDAGTEGAEAGGEGGEGARQWLGDSLRREREVRPLAPPQDFDWSSLFRWKWVALRWALAIGLAAWGLRLWMLTRGDSALAFFIGLAPIALAILLTIPETVRWVISPVTSLVDTLIEGSGGGSQADFWTADSLMEQGEHQLAMAEYRRIAIQYPREMEAYLKGIRAARALDNQKEAERFRDLALKNLKTEQDRNLFLNSLERMS